VQVATGRRAGVLHNTPGAISRDAARREADAYPNRNAKSNVQKDLERITLQRYESASKGLLSSVANGEALPDPEMRSPAVGSGRAQSQSHEEVFSKAENNASGLDLQARIFRHATARTIAALEVRA
jgi:hypothetical protein